MEAAERTQQLEQALTGGAWSFALMVFAWQIPFVPLIAGGFLCRALLRTAAASDTDTARTMRLAAWLVLPAMSVGTAVLVIDPRWMAVALPCAAGGLYAAVVGFARMAEWFGGPARWRRARHEAALVTAALCTLAGLMVARPANSARRVSFGDGDAVPVQVAAAMAIAAALFGLYRIGAAFNDLRLRVIAANRHAEQASTLTTHG